MQKSNCILNLNLFMFVSPKLDCSIEMLRYICRYVCQYVGMLVCLQKICMPKCMGRITWSKYTHAQSKFGAIKRTYGMRSIYFDYTIELL